MENFDSVVLQVVAGIFIHPVTGNILIAKRPLDVNEGGKWEFPGGKINLQEATFDALVRECDEELGCKILNATFYEVVESAVVRIEFWRVTAYQQEPFGREGQEIRWVPLNTLCDYIFPAMNKKIVDQLIYLNINRP